MKEQNINSFSRFIVNNNPYAQCILSGNDEFPNISGTVNFYNLLSGVLIVAEVFNLPNTLSDDLAKRYGPFYGFHLHEGIKCGDGNIQDPFKDSGGHYNPTGAPHPYHAGDFPPLLGLENGYAYSSFYTSRLKADEIIGKTIIVHQHADDFQTQPSGNSGKKIACGVVTSRI